MEYFIIIYSKDTVGDIAYSLLFMTVFLPSTHVQPLLLQSLFSVRKIRGSSDNYLSFIDILLAFRGVNVSLLCIWVNFDSTVCYPFSLKRFKPSFKLYLCSIIIPSICSIYPYLVIMYYNLSSKLNNMSPSLYLFPWNVVSYLSVWCLSLFDQPTWPHSVRIIGWWSSNIIT